ncbi:charged multivesicular body protein 4c [Sitophilus oryzae]|uniref:Charged multivesicular body protein 4c n=1 Tax=Sitophilus oryzae TaxID=7048 RepID=A0A6J2Y8P8_SITOR|nr:charged multivesicular body protein 4c [Sitophilus oryzae]
MSFFGKIFGGKKEEAPSTSDAIQKLRETQDLLTKKQEYLEKQIDDLLLVARKNASKNKRVALQALKKKKRLEKTLQQVDGTLTTLELQKDALEGANTNAAVLISMKDAAAALKYAHKNLDIDNVHDIMDDIAEQHDIANEISNAISNPVGFGEDIDEDELNKELEELETEELESGLIDVPGPTKLPPLPTQLDEDEKAKIKKPAKKVEDDDDMKELEAWAS